MPSSCQSSIWSVFTTTKCWIYAKLWINLILASNYTICRYVTTSSGSSYVFLTFDHYNVDVAVPLGLDLQVMSLNFFQFSSMPSATKSIQTFHTVRQSAKISHISFHISNFLNHLYKKRRAGGNEIEDYAMAVIIRKK